MGSDTNNTITGNVVHDNGTDGIVISGNTQDSAITGNTIYSNGANGVNISGVGGAGNNIISAHDLTELKLK